MAAITTLGSLLGLAFLSGLRLYSTVLAVGLGVRFGLITPPSSLSHLDVLASTPVIAVSGIAFAAEFLADKVPWVDTIWDLLHTAVRPLGAAVLGAVAVGSVDPRLQVAAFIICGGVAFAGHTAKTGTRIAANHSPEPVSNIGLSLFEDGVVAAGSWFIFAHPIAALVVVLLLLLAIAWMIPRLYRLMRRALSGMGSAVRNTFG